MIKVSVLYPNGAGAKFDIDYYLKSHMPMVQKKLGAALKGVSIEEGLGGIPPGSPAPYLAGCGLLFDSVEEFGAAFTPHAEWITADIPNYTNTQPTIQIGLVKL
jgi:uncharacterized protein (TIGR02118 family)